MLNRLKNNIPSYALFILKFFLLNILFFFLERLLFYYYNKPTYQFNTDNNLIRKAFLIGVEFDMSVLCWFILIPVVLYFINSFLKNNILQKFTNLLLLIFTGVYHFVGYANMPFYKQFGTHLNKTAFLWNDSPSFALGVIFGSFSYWGFLIPWIVTMSVIIFISKKWMQQLSINNLKHTVKLFFFIIIGVMIIAGARGRITDRTGLHEGIAIVSDNGFVNQIAINPNFTFWKSVFTKSKKYTIPNTIKNDIQTTQGYFNIKNPLNESIQRFTNDTTLKKHHYNFVIVVMESMCLYKMGYYNGKNLTSQLDKLNKESVFFNNFFSSGIHTFNGLFSTTSGYPSIYEEHGLKSYVKKPFNGLGLLLDSLGYENYFYTTHDPNFDNMQGFFKLNKFKHIISEYDFDYSKKESSLGVPDHVLLDKVIEVANNRKTKKPFLSVVMTASDHGPWKIPTNINYKPTGKTPQENCTLYADWAIGRFIEKAKKQNWYDNTVFIFLGDHGLSMGHTYEMPISFHHIPCIIHQPNLFKSDTISSPCYQPDITPTVMGIIGEPFNNETFGINILKEKHPYVVFSADDKIGCVDSSGFYYYITLNNHQKYLRKYKALDPTNYYNTLKQKADSTHNKMMSIYNTAHYYLRKEFFLYD